MARSKHSAIPDEQPGPDGVRVRPAVTGDDVDTEGHRMVRASGSDETPGPDGGFRMGAVPAPDDADDQDTEGHVKRY